MLEGNLLFVHLSIQRDMYTNDMLEGNLLFVHLSIQTTC